MPRPVDPIKRLMRAFQRATRPALERTFVFWREHMAPFHFQRDAFGKYPKEYGQSAKRNMAKWLAKRQKQVAKRTVDPMARPMVKSRRFRESFLHGGTLYTGSAERLRVRWSGLPAHASMRNRFSGFQPSEAATVVSPEEVDTMRDVYHGWLLKFAEDDSRIPLRTHGVAVLKT